MTAIEVGSWRKQLMCIRLVISLPRNEPCVSTAALAFRLLIIQKAQGLPFKSSEPPGLQRAPFIKRGSACKREKGWPDGRGRRMNERNSRLVRFKISCRRTSSSGHCELICLGRGCLCAPPAVCWHFNQVFKELSKSRCGVYSASYVRTRAEFYSSVFFIF